MAARVLGVKIFYEKLNDEYTIVGELPHEDALSEARDLGYITVLKGPLGRRGVDTRYADHVHIPWDRVIRIEQI